MERPRSNPNEAVTAIYIGEKLVYVPVIEYYVYNEMKPEEAMARLALSQTIEKKENDV